MSASHHPQGKILSHGQGAGQVTREALQKRAKELAMIQGRPNGAVFDEDREQARIELSGGLEAAPVREDETDTTVSMSRDPSDPIAVRGHQTPMRINPDDEDGAVERLAQEGVEEAQHDQMLADRRRGAH